MKNQEIRQLLADMPNLPVVIRFIEDAVQNESTVKMANRIIKNELGYLTSDYTITQVKILLSILRRMEGITSLSTITMP